MLKIPECPRDIEELDCLLYGLTNPRFDAHPKFLKRESEIEKGLLKKFPGLSEEVASKISEVFEFEKEDEESYGLMLKWGDTRKQAARRYLAHFNAPCLNCVDIYTDVLAKNVEAMLRFGDVNIRQNPEQMDKLLLETHLERLGSENLKNLGIGIDYNLLFGGKN